MKGINRKEKKKQFWNNKKIKESKKFIGSRSLPKKRVYLSKLKISFDSFDLD